MRHIETFLEHPMVPEHNKIIVKSAQHSPIVSHMFNAIPSQKGLALNLSHMRIMLHLLLGVVMEFESNVCWCGQVQRFLSFLSPLLAFSLSLVPFAFLALPLSQSVKFSFMHNSHCPLAAKKSAFNAWV